MNFIGIDIGTTSICGVVIDVRKGKLSASLTLPNNSWLSAKHPWERMQNPAKIIATAERILNSFTTRYGPMAGIGITGQMHGILYVDSSGRAVSPLFTWQDERGRLMFKKNMTYAEKLSRMTGHPLAPGFGFVTHFYNLMNGIVPRSAAFLCTIADYVAMRFASQNRPFIDPTNAAGIGIFNLKKLCFAGDAFRSARLRPGLLPRLVNTGDKIGITSDKIPVFAAPGDNQASILGSVREVKNSFVVNIGTGGQISRWLPTCQFIKGLELRPFPGGGYLAVGASLCGGKAYALLENFFKDVCFHFAGVKPKDAYSVMNRLVSAGEEPPVVDTRFAGTRLDPKGCGTIRGISMKNFTAGHLTEGFLRGIADELGAFYRLMPRKTQSHNILVGSGNGIRFNPRLRSILEKTFGLTMNISCFPEEAASGAALSAAVGARYYENYFEAGKIIRYE